MAVTADMVKSVREELGVGLLEAAKIARSRDKINRLRALRDMAQEPALYLLIKLLLEDEEGA